MRLNHWAIAAISCVALLLAACTQKDTPGTAKPAKQEVSVQAVAAQAKGFTVGAVMSANTVYVFFDPQCPHCGHLWQASIPLQRKVKFVWIPVAWINASSLSQGAALLTAANPLELMTEHEALLLAGKGGISAPSGVGSDVEQAIKANTKLLSGFGAESVPFIVVKNSRTGETISRDGALATADLANLIGIDLAP